MLVINSLEAGRKIPPTPLKKGGKKAPLYTANKNRAIEKGLTQGEDRGNNGGDCPYKQASDGLCKSLKLKHRDRETKTL